MEVEIIENEEITIRHMTAIVKSEKNHGAYYKITCTKEANAPEEWKCSCPDYTFRGNECKHIKAVKKKGGFNG